MRISKILNGVDYLYDTNTNRYLNPKTNKWVLKPRSAVGKSVGKSTDTINSKYIFYIIDNPNVDMAFNEFATTKYRGECFHLYLTKIYQKSRHNFTVYDKHSCCIPKMDARLLGGSYSNLILDTLIKHNVVTVEYIPFRDGSGVRKEYKEVTISNDVLRSDYTCHKIKHRKIHTNVKMYYKQILNNLRGVDKSIFLHMIKKTNIVITEDQFVADIKNIIHPNYKRRKGEGALSVTAYLRDAMGIFRRFKSFNDAIPVERLTSTSTDKFGHRFHSIASSTNHALLKYFEVDGVKMDTYIDLRQSQPTIACNVLKRHGVTDGNFVDAVNSLKFYEEIMEVYGIDFRPNAKIKTFEILFGSIFGDGHDEFCELFPEAGKVFGKIKSVKRDAKRWGLRKDHKANANLAMDLQREESKLFRMIWHDLISARVKFLPVHDGIVCNHKDKDIVMNLMSWILDEHLVADYILDVESL